MVHRLSQEEVLFFALILWETRTDVSIIFCFFFCLGEKLTQTLVHHTLIFMQ